MQATPESDITHLTETATKNVSDIVHTAIEHTSSHKALVVYDTESGLAEILVEAYRKVLPDAIFLDFNTHAKEDIIASFDTLSPRDLVVLIQSTDFRLNQFRIRIYLFQKKLKVIDHLHLLRNTPDSWSTYINALAYDEAWYRGTGKKLKSVLQDTSELRVQSGGAEIVIQGGLEDPKLNIGDYTGMENIGGTFPIGEIFTEARGLTQVNGSLMIYAFADTSYNIAMHEPFRIDIKDGILVDWDTDTTPQTFIDMVGQVRAQERALIREVGFGLNRAITREHYLKDITAFERIFGMHFSLGEKHTVFKKEGIKADKTRFHVDIFPMVERVYADNTVIFEKNSFAF